MSWEPIECSTVDPLAELAEIFEEPAKPQWTPPAAASDLEYHVKRRLDRYSRWTPAPADQPEWGRQLGAWMDRNGWHAANLSAALEVGSETIRRWLKGSVPQEENRDALLELGFDGDFWPTPWKQSQFVRAELVECKNHSWRGEESPGKQYFDAYAVTVRHFRTVRGHQVEELKEVIFGTRVSSVIGVLSKGDVLSDWCACQALNHALGTPVLRGTKNVGGVCEPVEIRGTWRKIEANQKACLSSEVTIEHNHSRLRPGIAYTAQQLLDAHLWAYTLRYKERDDAAWYGTRAHHLGHAWIKFHAYQRRDSDGFARVDQIYAPEWFWNQESRSPELVSIDIYFEPLEVQNALRALEKFFAVNQFDVVASEELLADLALGVAGACDCVVRTRSGELLLLDWKTSNDVRESMWLQVAWYTRLWWLNKGEMPARSYIVRLDKRSAELEVVPVYETARQRQELLEAAVVALKLYRWSERAESRLNRYRQEKRKAAKADGGPQ